MNPLSILITIATFVSSLVGVHPQVVAPIVATSNPVQEVKLGAAPSPIAGSTYNLAGSGVSSSVTTITLQSLTIKQTGQPILTSDLRQGASDTFYVTLEPGNNSRQEIVGCTGVTQNNGGTATLTGCSRGLSPLYPYAASTTLAFVHAGGSQAIFGDAPQLFNDFKTYVDSAVVSGAVDSSLTAKGIVEKAAASEAAGHAAVGSGNTTAPLVLTTDIASSTRGVGSQVIVASTTGYLDPSYLNLALSIPGFSVVGATTTLGATSTTNIGAFPAYDIGKHMQVIAAVGTSTFQVPSGIHLIWVRMVGGGGSGASSGSATVSGSGGGAGAYVEGAVDVSATTSITVYVSPGAASSGSGSGNGKDSSWSTFGVMGFYLSAPGGRGGVTSGAGGSGGATTTPSTQYLNIPGGDGQDSVAATGLSLTNHGLSMGGTSFFGGWSSGTGICYGSGSHGQDNNGGTPAGCQGLITVSW